MMKKINIERRKNIFAVGKILSVLPFYFITPAAFSSSKKDDINNIADLAKKAKNAKMQNSESDTKKTEVIELRLWSSPEYSRITIENSQNLKYVIDTESANLLKINISGINIPENKINFEEELLWLDPYIKHFDINNTAQGTTLNISFKTEVAPQVFTAEPISIYKNRLFIDLYPKKGFDPLIILLTSEKKLDLLEENNLILNPEDIIGKSDNELSTMLANLGKPKEKNPLDTFIENEINNQDKAKTIVKPPTQPTTKPSAPAVIKPRRRLIVVLDPGHGGEDPGAVGRFKSYEKNIVLAISRLAKSELEKFGFIALLTRDKDFFIPLRRRVEIARKINADLFLSIHADAFTSPRPRGSSIYVLSESGASSQAAKWIANKENSADKVGGVKTANLSEIKQTLQDLVKSRTTGLSKSLAQNTLQELAKINSLHKKQVERAGFAVLRSPDIPSALIETAFISNPDEEKRLNNRDYQQALAKAIARGVFRYYSQL